VSVNVSDTTPGGVVDSIVANCFSTPFALAAGAVTNCITEASYPDQSGNIPDRVQAIGTDSVGNTVTNADTASVRLVPIPIHCTKLVSLDGVTFVNSLTLTNGTSTNVIFQATVYNDSTVALVVTSSSDSDANSCLNQAGLSIPLAAGGSVSIVCTNVISCPPGDDDTVTITAIVDVEAPGAPCALLPNGQVISNSTTCSAHIGCVTPLVQGCRTTGGGKQYASEHQVCPIHDPAFNSDVRYVTHGGQIGAPFGASSAPTITDCATGAGSGFNNPCIRGEYQHVRHMKGGLRGNFHAASNGNVHDFDSLMCACLPCDTFVESNPFGGCHPADRLYTGDGITENGLCNPNRTPNCGPEPRKAPDNKLAASGLGSYTKTNGKRELKVVFRIDIEDRGEPGNLHAITTAGKTNPPDRYRLRLWFTDGLTDAQIFQLREAVAVRNAHDERVGTAFGGTFQVGKLCNGSDIPAPDIDDGGDLDRGNRQIHPNTGAACND